MTVAMFRRVCLETNLEKTKALVCTSGYIWGKWSKAAYKRRATREGGTFRGRKRSRVIFSECGVIVSSLPLKGHMERCNGIIVLQKGELELRGGTSNLYGVLPLGAEDGDMPGDSLYSSSA